jgi:hypothetical protein
VKSTDYKPDERDLNRKGKIREINTITESVVFGSQTLLYRPFRDAAKIHQHWCVFIPLFSRSRVHHDKRFLLPFKNIKHIFSNM